MSRLHVLRTRSTSRMTHNGSKVFTLDSNDVIKPTVQNMSPFRKVHSVIVIKSIKLDQWALWELMTPRYLKCLRTMNNKVFSGNRGRVVERLWLKRMKCWFSIMNRNPWQCLRLLGFRLYSTWILMDELCILIMKLWQMFLLSGSFTSFSQAHFVIFTNYKPYTETPALFPANAILSH